MNSKYWAPTPGLGVARRDLPPGNTEGRSQGGRWVGVGRGSGDVVLVSQLSRSACVRGIGIWCLWVSDLPGAEYSRGIFLVSDGASH